MAIALRALDRTRPTRQFKITHRGTGETWLVYTNARPRPDRPRTHESGTLRHASALAGMRYPADCTVSLVATSDEIPLPFDLPLRVRPPQHPDARPIVGRITVYDA